MIRCTPHGIFSWSFHVTSEKHEATLEFGWFGEQGAITIDGDRLEVCKHGMFSGQWTLERGGSVIVSGQKSNIFTRTFEVNDTQGGLVLRAVSPFGRSFQLERYGELVASIAPDHAFTRRATIATKTQALEFATICFSFWLVVLTWRRAAKNNT